MASYLSEEDHARVSEAVSAAEAQTSGEIVTILTQRSDGYADVALAWSVLVAFTAIVVLSLFPDFYLGLFDRLTGVSTLVSRARFDLSQSCSLFRCVVSRRLSIIVLMLSFSSATSPRAST